MRVLIFGLPGSGKTTLAKLLMEHLPCLYLNGDEVRSLFNDQDFSPQARVVQAKRMRSLAEMAQGILVIADFVCPTEETRRIFDPDLSIWMDTIKDCCFEDTNSIFQSAAKADIIITVKDAKAQAGMIIKMIKEI